MRAFVAAFAFLTRLPVGAPSLREADLGRAVAFFPLVGCALGAVLAALALAMGPALGPWLTSALLVALLAGLTGGLHLDGLADLFDALGGGRGDRARMLEIMRDSRVGAHGAAALVILLLVKVLALGQILERHDLLAVLAFPAIARWAVTPAIVFFPYARADGLGRAFTSEAGPRQVVGATLVVGLLVAACGVRLLVPVLVALGAVLLVAAVMRRRLGGLTGDVYGAAIEIAEAAALVAAVAHRII